MERYEGPDADKPAEDSKPSVIDTLKDALQGFIGDHLKNLGITGDKSAGPKKPATTDSSGNAVPAGTAGDTADRLSGAVQAASQGVADANTAPK
jgi:hypothetical protein